MPYEDHVTVRQCCQLHSYYNILQEPQTRRVAKDIRMRLHDYTGSSCLYEKREQGLLDLKHSPLRGNFLAAARDVPAGTIMGVAYCAVKMMDGNTLSTTEDSDMELRYVHLLQDLFPVYRQLASAFYRTHQEHTADIASWENACVPQLQ